METRQINRRLETRRIIITEVNIAQGFILGKDTWDNPIRVTFSFHDSVVTVPQAGELWYVKRSDLDWILDKKAESGSEQTSVSSLSPGDKRIEATNNLYLSGVNIYLNGTSITDIVAASLLKPGQLWMTAAGMWTSTTSGANPATLTEFPTNKQNLYTLDFVDGSTTFAEANIMMPSDWDQGTVTAQFAWVCASGNTSSVVWGLQGRMYTPGDLIDQAWGVAQTIVSPNTTLSNQLHVSDSTPAVTLSGSGLFTAFRIQRVGGHINDSLTQNAKLIGVSLTYQRA